MSHLPSHSLSFAKGVIARLALWPALRIAVQNSWGGPDSSKKQTWMASVIVDAFEEQPTPPDAEYIEELLLQIMDDEFETVIEDGSTESVARDITTLWKDVQLGDLAGLHRLEQQADANANRPVVSQLGHSEAMDTDSDEEEGDWESDEEDGPSSDPAPDLQIPEVDEDGFTTVKGRHSKHR
ncbi:Pre-rRNA-processing protein TSR2-domain-containing protein [Thelephora terrestris]|jgi:pre-rRNA-processing protein TSR2|uniref:Pre-rRNA-processing protein TSR2-domain-containing protein n=1 Tax=Thelephora terrestris TaxID=56493 RepID=A0A9P6L473_9AGAM|nr:Pre-rRNA-processing protein TSR2-domain-containing protein [Thelephora terrestris]